MCLVSKNFFPKIAKTNITCYKEFSIEFDDKSLKFVSPYRRYDYTKSVLETKVLKPSFSSIIKQIFNHFSLSTLDYFSEFKRYEVHDGYVHAYQKPYGDFDSNGQYFLVKCYIPKGTFYYKDYGSTFAARKIVICDEELDEKIEQIKQNQMEFIKKIEEEKQYLREVRKLKKRLKKKKKKHRK